MRKIIIILLLNIFTNVYADADMPDDFNFDINRASEMLQHENARNPNRYNTSEMRDSINNWLSDPTNLKAVSGEEGNTLKTLGGADVNLNKQCTVSQKQLAELKIEGSKPVAMRLNISNGQSYIFNNILGVCENKVTVCDINENKRICNDYLKFKYTDYKTTGQAIPEKEKSIAVSHICYSVSQCMSWQFAVDETGSIVSVKNAAGENCSELKDSGITVGQRDYIIRHIENVLTELSKEGLSHTASSEENKQVIYNELSYNDCTGDNYSKYGSGMTNIGDLMDYYNNPKNNEQDKNNMYKDLSSNSDMAQKLENQKGLEDYDNLSSRFDTAAGGISSGFDRIDTVIESVPEDILETVQTCYNPTCTIDVVYQKSVKSSTGNNIGEDHISRERIFRQCEPVALVKKGFDNSSETMEFTCPVNSSDANVVETLVKQSDGKECACNNEHQQSANLQKVLIATKLAELLNGELCPKDENDNETLSTANDKRKECSEKCQGSNNYQQCIADCTKIDSSK